MDVNNSLSKKLSPDLEIQSQPQSSPIMGQPKDLESNPSPTYNVSSTHDSSNHDHISTSESDFVDAPFEVDEPDPTS